MIVEHKIRLTYPAHLLSQPLLYQLIRQYDLFTNILRADVTAETGRLTLEIRGEDESVQKGLSWLAEQGVQVEILGEAP